MFRRVSDCRDYPGCRDGNGGTQQQSGGERRGTEPCTAQEIDRIKDMGDCEKRSLQQKHAAFSAIVAGGGHQQAERHERTVPFCRDERNDGKIKHGKGEDQRQQRQAEMLPHAVHCDRNGISRQQRYVCTLLHCVPSIRPVRTFGNTTASGFRAVRKIPLPPNGPTTAACRKRFRNRTVPKTTAAPATAGE